MTQLISSNAALIIIDVQKGFDDPKWGRRNNPQAESNIAKLLDIWRLEKRPVIHVQHCSDKPTSPLNPNQEGVNFKAEGMPIEGEQIFQKSVNSAFIGTTIES